jgi:hypothetical protein
MGNPRTTALISAAGIVLVGANMLFNRGEAPSPVLGILQWVLLIAGVIGLVGSLVELGKK